jgi:hypothetical protein
MWLITTTGFFSVVEKPWDREHQTVTVRARVAADLEALRTAYLPGLGPTETDPEADYRFRAQVPRRQFAEALSRMALDVDYDNFKNAVEARQGHARSALYERVWIDLLALQRGDGFPHG